MKLFRTPGRYAALALAAALWLTARPAAAQSSLAELKRDNPKIIHLFRGVVADASEGTVRVRQDGKDVALGTVVGADGWILTKYGELSPGKEIVCRFKDGKELPAQITAVHEAFDLALLKVNATGLHPVEWAVARDATVGRWVASAAPADDPVAVGVIGVAARDYKAGDQPSKTLLTNSGWLGVALGDAEGGGALVTGVMKGSPAANAGLQVNDVVVAVNEKKVLGAESMINTVGRHKPNDEISLKVRRGEDELDVRAKLGKRPPGLFNINPQEKMGSELSNRRGGFPTILQHDTVIKPSDCGGPLVDLDGKVVGINIARAGRTESYAIPAGVIRELLPRMMAGDFPPPPPEKEEPPAPGGRERESPPRR